MPVRAVLRFFVAVICLAPLPLGANRPWSWSLLGLCLALALLAWTWSATRDDPEPAISLRRILVPALLFAAAMTWGVVQTLPVVPDAWAHPLWSEAEAILGPLPRTISLHPEAGREALMRLLAYAAAFFLALQMGRSVTMANTLVEAIALAGTALAAYGLAAYASGTETILWLDKTAYRGTLTATLVNRNHYATLAGLGLLAALVVVLRRFRGLTARQCGRLLLLERHPRTWAILIGVMLLALALAFTQSRGGIFAALVGIATLVVVRRPDPEAPAWRNFGLAAAIALLAAIIGTGLSGRMESTGADVDMRVRIAALTLDILRQYPLQGIGLGGFADAFAAVRPVGLVQIWEQAHNVWFEILVDLGIPAGACLIAAVVWLAGHCIWGARTRRRDAEFPALGVAAAVLVGSHGMMDFSLQIPAVAVTFAVLLGVAVAQSWSSRLGRRL